MRQGDKLYCFKTLTHLNVNFYIENKWYEIISISTHEINIKDERDKVSTFDTISDYSIHYYKFHRYKFQNFFLTQKQMRNLKLKNLCLK
jgi:hypothetical protein